VAEIDHRHRLFDNGHNTITLAAGRSPASDTLVVTFDPFGALNPDSPGFGEALLTRQGFDVLSVQKRQEDYYQHLSREAFATATREVFARYRKLVFYGSSVGAYAALYFGAEYAADILALSPRVSSHPIYQQADPASVARPGRHRHGPISVRPVRAGRVVLVYDPVLARASAGPSDIAYMHAEILPAFPGIQLLALRHTGHPSATALAETHALKPMLLDFIRSGSCSPAQYRRGKRSAPSYLLNLSFWLAQRGRPRWARAICDKALRLAPQRPVLLFHKSDLLKEAGDPQGAIRMAERALQLAPAEHPRRSALIAALREAGDAAGALRVIEAGLDLPEELLSTRQRVTLLHRRARVLEGMGRIEEAHDVATQAATLGAPDAPLLFYVAQLEKRLSRGAAALAKVEEAIALQPDAGAFHRLRSEVLSGLGRQGEARQAQERAVDLQPDEPHWRMRLAQLTAEAGDTRRAVALLAEVTATAPLPTGLALQAAKLLHRLDEVETAIAVLREVVRRAPSEVQPRILLARLLFGAGQADLALQQVTQGLSREPEHADLNRLREEILRVTVAS
jgi:tetratricopeptide (TPR) repeat protein